MRKSADFFMFQVMLILCVTWGLQQIAIKLVVGDITTIVQASLRSGIAAFLVAIVLVIKGGWQPSWQGTSRAGMVVGLLFASEFLFIALGLQYTSASHMAVFLYTAPIFSALGLNFFVASERLKPLQWLGITVCFIGVVVAFGGSISFNEMNTTILLGDLFGLLAGIAWGATTVVVRSTKLSEAPASLTLFYQLFIAFISLLLIALATGQFATFNLTAISVSSLLFQGVIVSFVSYLVWFWLLRQYLANNLAVFSFMTPMFGVTFGVLILGEKLTINFIIGAMLILLGILLVSGEAALTRFIKRLN
ncbi:DMT family transporter [Entomomonas asaccharolytica]|uniref:DMT family transporter n=1 Tax=Entomomonas asaccharolytica TaxID=2785331 RepID=A0A974NG89_9GAMM|nr:DMT family transporter [Entomomonas asaccharolytica]QQP86101.1 DMT family transporter [Entomomonas asaccharolytica]